ncbi:MAG TPA: amidophosphoribosyltransferase [Nitrososphaerales archaeon]|nr:amidophosphoribosyltransferase [Nitrososphaerales archaeon]
MGAKEACAVVGAHSTRGADVVTKVLKGLEALQHRGQESWGIAVPGRPVFKRMGLAFNWVNFSRELAGYKGISGIGHIRYSTKGRSNLGNAQPIQIGNEFSIAHNGTIFNTGELQKTVLANRASADCSTDTKVVGHRLFQILKEENDWFWAFEKLAKEVAGAYSFTILNKQGEVFAVRDPRGYRPLCIGFHKKSGTHIAASESCALTAIDAEFVRDVEPGEIIRLGGPKRGFESFRFAPKMETAHCSFEYTYFAHPSSVINGVNVYEARKHVGRVLARRQKMKGKVVIPVPDSARPGALGYSLESGIPLDEGLMKDRYRRKGSIRSFIEPKQGRREEVVKRIIPIKETIKGRDVIVVDDSVVRGTSSQIIVDALREAGAKSIRMAITFPPIMHPCHMGVDFPSREELLAYRVAKGETDIEKIGAKVAASLGIAELHYNDIDGLAEAIGLPKNSLCFACINGDYSKLTTAKATKEKA